MIAVVDSSVFVTYDARFVALAEVLDAPLITCDVKQRHASGHQAVVEVFDPGGDAAVIPRLAR